MDIPVMNMPQQPKTSGNPLLADASAAAAPWRAVAEVGRSIQNLGGVFNAYAEKRRALDGNAAIAENNLWNTHTARTVEETLQDDQHRNNHEIWTSTTQDLWKTREEALGIVVPDGATFEDTISDIIEKTDDPYRQRILIDFAQSRAKSVDGVRLKEATRDVELKQMAILLNADEYYRNDMPEQGDAQIKKLGLPEAEERQLMEQRQKNGLYQIAEEELNLATTPAEFVAYIDLLQKKGEDGKYEEYDLLDPNQRRNLIKYADARRKRAELTQGQAVVSAQNKIANGTFDERDRQQLVLKGVDEKTIDALSQQAAAAGSYEEETKAFKNLQNKINQGWWSSKWNGNRNVKEMMSILNDINKEPFMPATRQKLVREWIDAYYADVSDGRMELTGWQDRELDKNELDFQEKMFEAYRLVNEDQVMSTAALGGLMKNQLLGFAEWYDGKEKVTPEEQKAKYNEFMVELFTEKGAAAAKKWVDEQIQLKNPKATEDIYGGGQ